MNTQNISDQIVTRTILQEELNKFELRLAVSLDKKIDEKFAHGFGLIKEYFDDQFSMFREGHMHLPEQVNVLKERIDENEEEHRNFRVRIGSLERSM